MKNFNATPAAISFEVDLSVYNDTVISKVLYWLSGEYNLSEYNTDRQTRMVTLERKNGEFTPDETLALKDKISRDLIDFKLRDIVGRETEHIRNILYIKAFAHGEQFDDFKLLSGD